MGNKMKAYNEEIGLSVESDTDVWVNQRTGEMREFQNVEKVYYGQRQFWKLYLQDFLAVLGIFESKQLNVICYIMENTDQRTNVFVGTMAEIAKACDCSRATVNTAIQRLLGANFLTQMKIKSMYRVNPNVMFQGSEFKKRGIMISYTEDKTRALPEDGGFELLEAGNLDD